MIQPSESDESIPEGTPPQEAVQALSLMKAMTIAQRHEEWLVIGADTIVVCDGSILGKPENEQQAFGMLSMLQGRSHDVYTGIAIVDAASLAHQTAYSRTKVFMKALDEEQIRRYIRTGEPNDKAGAYGIQGMGALLVEKIDGDYFTVVGLPLNLLARMLADHGVQLL